MDTPSNTAPHSEKQTFVFPSWQILGQIKVKLEDFQKDLTPLSWSVQRTPSSQLSETEGNWVLTLCNFSNFFQLISNFFGFISYPNFICLCLSPDPNLSALHVMNTYISIYLPGYWFLPKPRISAFYPEMNPRTNIHLVLAKSNGKASARAWELSAISGKQFSSKLVTYIVLNLVTSCYASLWP